MRFFRANQTPRSPEDEAAAVRLMAVAIRGKAASSPDRPEQTLPEAPGEAQARRSFR